MTTGKNVTFTKSGLIVREDDHLGLLVFSTHTGLIFACQATDGKALLRWLECKGSPPALEYEKALGPVWALPLNEAEYPSKHLLPTDQSGWTILRPDYPIVINWLLTGNCTLKCQYCYAEDLMRGCRIEPNAQEVENIAETILSYHPLAVVLTGGDPLLSPHLERVLDALHKKTGIIIDTSGFVFSSDHLNLLEKYDAFIRISIDSEIPKIHDRLRPPLSTTNANQSSNTAAINALCRCLDAGIGVGVQTVATKYNRSDLEAFGDKLYRIGIRSWRILVVAPSQTNMNSFEILRGTRIGQERYERYIEKHLRLKHDNGWNKGMAVQITHNKAPNSVVLVAPDGTFLTEATVNPQKIILDEKSPKNPRHDHFFDKINSDTHAERYLG
jgi:MoaA/NifB/PqqE/SkfB family radical SAM enzyme